MHGCYIDAVQSNEIDEWKKEEEERKEIFRQSSASWFKQNSEIINIITRHEG